MKNKKIIISLIIIISVFLFLISTFFVIKLFGNKEEINEMQIDVENIEKIDVSLFNTNSEAINIVEEKQNVGKMNITINGETVTDNLSVNNIIKQSYCKLKDNYYLIEVLIDKVGGLEPLEDSILSTDYNYIDSYAKVWYIYNSEIKEAYIFEDNTNTRELSLNPKITILDNVYYFEFDKMFKLGKDTDVNHYKIDLNELFSIALSTGNVDWMRYSTLYEEDILNGIEQYNVSGEEDLNKDGIKDSIDLKIYKDNFDLYKTGYLLSINDKFLKVLNGETIPAINIVDIDKNDDYKEVLILSYYEDEPDNKKVQIYSYINDEIVKTFDGYLYGIDLNAEKDFNYLDFSYNENNEIEISINFSDTVQNWEIKKKYRLNNEHILYEYKENDYYINAQEEAQILTANQEIVLYNSMNLDDKSSDILNPGQEVELIGTDLKFWFVILTDNGTRYIPLENDGTIKDLGLYPAVVFEGLNIYD